MDVEHTNDGPIRLKEPSEYFTVLILKDEPRLDLPFLEHVMPDRINSNALFNIDNGCQLIIQTVYLVYSAKIQHMRLQVNTAQDLVVDVRQVDGNSKSSFSVLMTYELKKEEGGEPCRVEVTKLITDILSYLIKVNKHQQHKYQTSTGLPPILHGFQLDFQLLTSLDIKNDRDFIFALEQTNLFRIHATVLRLMNSMLMNMLKRDDEVFRKLIDQARREKALVAQYKDFKDNKQTEKASIKTLEINDLFKIFFSETLKSLSNYRCSVSADQNSQQIKMDIRIKEKPAGFAQYMMSRYNAQAAQHQISDFKPSDLTYNVEYNSERNNISVRLNTPDVKLTVENQDIVYYQSNLLTYNYEEIGIQVVETQLSSSQSVNPNNPPVKNRQLAFKASIQNIQKEPILQRIIQLIDRVMIVYKMIEPHLSRIITRELEPAEEITKRTSHYLEIYEKCFNKIMAPLR